MGSLNGSPNGSVPMAAGEPLEMENGRGYHHYRKGAYMYPCDDEELGRLDLYHSIFKMVRDRKCLNPSAAATQASLCTAPISKFPDRILDLGTGTGIWAIETADMYPDANVIGVDLANSQPADIPLNVRFLVNQDFEDRWTFGQDSFDLIHLRCLVGSVSNWPMLYQKVLAHLKPGKGWMEHTEINWEPRSANGKVPLRVQQWWEHLQDATRRAGKPIAYLPTTTQVLKSLGFVDVEERVIRLPLSEWPEDRLECYYGRLANMGIRQSIPALSLAPFRRIFDWSLYDVNRYANEIEGYVSDRQYQIYNTIHIVTARRP